MCVAVTPDGASFITDDQGLGSTDKTLWQCVAMQKKSAKNPPPGDGIKFI
jgi:hypothetical protein